MRVITVGTSNIVRDMIKAFKLAGVTVHGCVSRSTDRAKEFALSNGIKFFLSDYDKALTSKNYDTVYIAVPNALHFEYAKKALEAGKNVIVEKPICSNIKDTIALYDLAKSKGLYIFENMTVLHNPTVKLLKEDLDLIGKVKYIEMNFYSKGKDYPDFIAGKNPPKFDPKLAGGSLMDMGVYNIALTLELLGMPDSLSYHPHIIDNIDVSGCSILNYDDAVASLNSGKDANSKNFICITGEKGYIFVNGPSNRFNSYDVFSDTDSSKRRKVNIEDYLSKNVRDFDYVINNNDYNLYNEYIKASKNEIKVLDSLRKSGKIIFD